MRLWGAGILVGSVVLIAWATLTPASGGTLPIACLACDEFALTDFVANIALFVPFGAGLSGVGMRGRRAIAVGFGATLAIETVQYFMIAGRDASVRDIVANTTGTAVGVWLVHEGPSLVSPSAARATTLTVTAIGMWLGVQAIGSWLETPSLPAAAYWGQWAPDLGNMRQFTGRIITAQLNGSRMPLLEVPSSDSLRASFRRTGIAVDIEALSDGAPPGLAPIVAMYDAKSRQIFLLGEDDRRAVFQSRRRAADLRLRNPGLAVRASLASRDTVQLRASFVAGRLLVDAGNGMDHAKADIPLGAWLLWSHFYPFPMHLEPWSMGLSVIWSAFLLVPIGAWGRMSGVPVTLLGGAGAVALLGGLVAIPLVLRQPVAPASIGVASVIGLVVGASAASARDRRSTRTHR